MNFLIKPLNILEISGEDCCNSRETCGCNSKESCGVEYKS